MKCIAAVLLLQVFLVSQIAEASLQLPALDVIKRIDRLEFKSCPGCRLNLQGDLKNFLHNEVKHGKIPGVTVDFIPAHRPELHFIDADGNTIGGIVVDRQPVHDVWVLMEELGF